MFLLTHIDCLLEESPHDPFKDSSKAGPGPRGQTMKKQDNWRCKCKDYECTCTGTGDAAKKKTVEIDKRWKKKYNREYKRWKRRQPKEIKDRNDLGRE